MNSIHYIPIQSWFPIKTIGQKPTDPLIFHWFSIDFPLDPMKYPWNLHLQLIFPWFSHEISIFVTTKLVVWQRCYVSGGGRLESSGGRCLWAAGWRQNGHGDKQVSYNHGSHMCIIYIYIHVHRKYRKDTCNSYYHIYCIYIYTPWIDIQYVYM